MRRFVALSLTLLLFSSFLTNNRRTTERYQTEACILAATVRVEVRGRLSSADGRQIPFVSIGHATVLDGRTLLTHNHYSLSFDAVSGGTVTRLSLFRADGTPLVQDMPLTAVAVVESGPETLVLDFGARNGRGFFDELGVASAQALPVESVTLSPGDEIAQVVWTADRETVVRWTTVIKVAMNSGAPVVRLDGDLAHGSSGGGVFWHGYHVANNWTRVLVLNDEGTIVTHFYNDAVLNEASVPADRSPVPQTTVAPLSGLQP